MRSPIHRTLQVEGGEALGEHYCVVLLHGRVRSAGVRSRGTGCPCPSPRPLLAPKHMLHVMRSSSTACHAGVRGCQPAPLVRRPQCTPLRRGPPFPDLAPCAIKPCAPPFHAGRSWTIHVARAGWEACKGGTVAPQHPAARGWTGGCGTKCRAARRSRGWTSDPAQQFPSPLLPPEAPQLL